MRLRVAVVVFFVCLSALFTLQDACAQDPVAAVEGEVLDPSSAAIVGAAVTVTNLDTGNSKNQVTNANGFYRLSLLPVGRYAVLIEAAGFSRFLQQPVQLNVSQTVRLELASQRESITVEADAGQVDTATNTLGRL
jgi:Carboxypeptidase regulatory-like domain